MIFHPAAGDGWLLKAIARELRLRELRTLPPRPTLTDYYAAVPELLNYRNAAILARIIDMRVKQ